MPPLHALLLVCMSRLSNTFAPPSARAFSGGARAFRPVDTRSRGCSWRGADAATGGGTRRAATRGAGEPSGSAATTDLLAGLRARAEDLRRAENEEARREEMRPTELTHAWVVLFRGDASGDGIHSLSSGGREIVLAFESLDEARRFALVLKAQGFYRPAPHRMSIAALEDFCETDDRIDLLQVPEGTCIVPPEAAVDDIDFAAFEAEPAAEGGALTDDQLVEAKARLEMIVGG